MKKRLFITSALMTAVMAASLATGTYAWYASSSSWGVSATGAGYGITTNANSKLGDLELTSKFANIKALDLTDPKDGKTYVWNGNEKVESTADLSAEKNCIVTLTFEDLADMAKLSSYVGTTYTVTVQATKFLRIANSTSGLFESNAAAAVVGNDKQKEYNEDTTSIEVGTVSIVHDTTYKFVYASKLSDETHAADAGLHFYLSVSPNNNDGTETGTGNTGGHTDTESANYYGTLSVLSLVQKIS